MGEKKEQPHSATPGLHLLPSPVTDNHGREGMEENPGNSFFTCAQQW